MSSRSVEPGSRAGSFRDGWAWLVIAAVARNYLTTMLALAAFAILPALAGMSGTVVLSSSMEPNIRPGDVVLSQPFDHGAPVPMGRVVSFPALGPAGDVRLMLHRVIGSNDDGTFITAGDANANADSSALDPVNIVSQARLLVPFVGLPSLWVRTGMVVPLALWVLVTIGAIVIDLSNAAARRISARHSEPDPPKGGAGGTGAANGSDDANDADSAQAARATQRPFGRDPARTSRLRRIRAVGWRTGLLITAMLAAVVLAAASTTGSAAAFSAGTSSIGNSWVAATTATHLVVATNPSNAAGGTAFAIQPIVVIKDGTGAVLASSTDPVTLSLTTDSGATLTCAANPVTAIAGVASFSGCRVDKVGTYSLTATSGKINPAFSTNFAVSVGPATKLAFSQSPSNTRTSTSFSNQPKVTVQDAGGNAVTTSTASVALAITPPTGGATLSCSANPKAAVTGLATFSSCKINTRGQYTLTANSSGLTSAVSAPFVISSSATKLAFATNPSGATGGSVFATQPVVLVQDAGGNTVAGNTASVTLRLTTAGGAVLTCTSNPRSAVAGIATFAGCRINKAGTYTLTASASNVTSATSASFTITVGAPTKLGFTRNASGASGGTAFTTQPIVAVQDAGGNTVTSGTQSVNLSITTPAGAILSCTTNPLSATAGFVSFAGCRIDKAGTYTLTATSAGLTTAVSSSFTVSTGSSSKLAFTASPGDTVTNAAFASQPRVATLDAGGNTTTSTSSVTLTITPPSGGAVLSCTANPKAAVSGVVTFAGCKITGLGTYTLTATSGSLTSTISSTFTITP